MKTIPSARAPVLRYRSITKEREERKDGGVAARLSVPQPRVQCSFCNGRNNESEKRKARCCGQWHLGVRGGHESGPDGLYRHFELHFQVRYDFSDHCNNRIKTIHVFKINVTRRLYAPFLRKTGSLNGFFTGFCKKKFRGAAKNPEKCMDYHQYCGWNC
jgi:hypothetical protein